jgi:outer membrane receptor protein involved in Fe transport
MTEIERGAAFTPTYRVSARLNANVSHHFAFAVCGLLVGEQSNYYPNYDNYPVILMDVKKLSHYFVLNANVYKTLFNYLTVSVGANNLLDTQYATQFGNSMYDLDYPMQGRTLFAQVGWQHK